MLRPSLLPGMLTMLAHNLNRNVDDVRLFEMGTVFTGSPDRVDEAQWLAFGATGQLLDGLHSARAVDFYDLKGLVEAITARFTTRSVYFDAFPPESGLLPRWLNPGRAARCVVDGATIGYFGQLHPDESAQRKLSQPVFIGEIYLDRLFRQSLRQPVCAGALALPARPPRLLADLPGHRALGRGWLRARRARNRRAQGLPAGRDLPRRQRQSRSRRPLLDARLAPPSSRPNAPCATKSCSLVLASSARWNRSAASSAHSTRCPCGRYRFGHTYAQGAKSDLPSLVCIGRYTALRSSPRFPRRAVRLYGSGSNGHDGSGRETLAAADFQALEERVMRAVELLKAEREAHAAATAKIEDLQRHSAELERQLASRGENRRGWRARSATCSRSGTTYAAASSGC